MAQFSNCLQIVNNMPERDQEALLSRLDQLQAQGLSAKEAQLQAAIDVLAQVEREGQVRKSADRTWSGDGYRALNYNPPKNATVADVVRYESEELGNADIGEMADESANQLGIDLSAIPASDAIWVTHTVEQAMQYGERSDIDKYPVNGWLILADLGDEGALLLNPKHAQGILKSVDRPQFYSQLQRSIEQVPERLATMAAPAWKQWLTANASKLGIKADELEWSGIKDYLDLQGKAKLNKADLSSYLDDSGVKISEVQLDDADAKRSRADKEAAANKLTRATLELREATPNIRQLDGANLTGWAEDAYAGDEFAQRKIQALSLDDNAMAAVREYGRVAAEFNEVHNTRNSPATKYGQYTLPGGENYREVLITLPVTPKDGATIQQASSGFWRVTFKNGDTAMFKTESEARAAAGGSDAYTSSHWDQKNILAHIRVNDRVAQEPGFIVRNTRSGNRSEVFATREQAEDYQAKMPASLKTEIVEQPREVKVLFVEEVQSDWGQEGKKKGFAGQNGAPLSEQEYKRAAELQKRDRLGGEPLSATERAEFDALMARHTRAHEGLMVPNAPFVTKTEGWLNLALKRIAMMAVEGGYDKVAFVNGEQSADRYSLEKQVDELSYEPTAKGYYINVMASGRNIKSGDFTKSELEDIVGKEIVQKMDAREGKVEGTPGAPDYEDLKDIRTLSGDGLKVGGEGMKTFYDKLVPQALNKLLPKLGGEKLGAVEIDVQGTGLQTRYEYQGPELKRSEIDAIARSGDFSVSIERQLREIGSFVEVGVPMAEAVQKYGSISAAEALGGKLVPMKNAMSAQPGFDVTDKMRETVSAGVPLFSRDRQTETPEFKKWFGDSKVVDAEGKPLVVYHGTGGDFDSFDAARSGQNYARRGGEKGFFFTNRPIPAGVYAEQASGAFFGDEENPRFGDGTANIMPVYLSLQNPYVRKATGSPDKWFDSNHSALLAAAEKAGADGIIVNGGKGFEIRSVYIAFSPTQIKSATGNNGQFDATNPDIRKSADRPWFDDLSKLKVTTNYQLGDLLKTSKKLSWWDRTIGTQYNLAQKHPQFKRVFDAVQRFINDVSLYATRAADLAPTWLPKLDGISDINPFSKNFKRPVSAEDVKALRDPIFGGTLKYTRDENGELIESDDVSTAGVVFTNEELRTNFGLNDRQIGLYREFRKSVNKSISDLAVSDSLRYLGKDGEGVRQRALDAANLDDALNAMVAHLDQLIAQQPERAEVLEDSKRVIKEKAGQAIGAMSRGYAPLSRFGEYTVYATGEGLEEPIFFMFENERDANVRARELQREFPDANIEQGTMSQESYKLFSGVTPESLALFGEALGLEESGADTKSQAFQMMLKMAKGNRSAMKRMIERKGIEGFSEDAGRVLAGFVYSNARQISTNLHAGEIARSVQEIDQRNGDVKDQAVRLMEYVQNPREEAQALRGLMFTQFIGGSIASAIVNMTQPFTMTLPYLSQFDGATGAASRMADAVKLASRGIRNDDDLKAALKRGEDLGIVSPQEVHQLMAQAQGKGKLQTGDGTKMGDAAAKVNNGLAKLGLAWGKVFSAAEQFNRRVTFIAAYKLARDQGMADPMAFAEKAIAETQGVYNKGNKPNWARGAVGGTLFTFKQYSIGYLEFLRRMWGNGPEGKKAVGLALGVLFLMSGLGGMPGSDDLDDVIDGFMQRVLGRSFDSKQAKKEFFASILGQSGAEFVMSGLSGLPGMPIDFSGRTGLGNIAPGTGIFTKKRDYAQDYKEVLGPVGTLATNAGSFLANFAAGEFGKAAESVAPVAAQNVIKAIDMAQMGFYRDAKGRKVIDTTLSEAILKGAGFQPRSVSQIQQATGEQQGLIAQNRLAWQEIRDLAVAGRVEKDEAKLAEARRRFGQWNRNNPDSPIRWNQESINSGVKEANKPKAERIADAAPKQIRGTVKRELEKAD
jgi:hypothetical protein